MRPLYNVLDPVQLGPAPVFVVVLEPPAGAFVWGIPSSREQLLGLTCDANRALLDTLLLGGGGSLWGGLVLLGAGRSMIGALLLLLVSWVTPKGQLQPSQEQNGR